MSIRRALAALAIPGLVVAAAALADWRLLIRAWRAPAEPVGAVGWYSPVVAVGRADGEPLPVAEAAARTLDDTALDAARAYARRLESYALLVAHRGVIQTEEYADGFGPARRLDSQSLHKPLVGILTIAAVADGLLGLDDPLGRFIPAWRDDPRGRITVRDVLYMQSGLAEPRFEDKLTNAAYRLFITSHLEDAILALPLESEPGTHFRSHYAATQLLQLVLESASGKPYADYLDERLWTPLGAGEAHVRLDRPGGNAQVFCCLQARPRDWLRVGLMLAGHGQYGGRQILPMAAFVELTTPSPLAANFAMQQVWRGSPYSAVRMADSRNPTRGLPMSAPFAADDVFYLEGRGGQRVYVVPSRELVVVRQGVVRMDWDDAAFLNPLIAAAPARVPGSGPPSPGHAFSALLAPPAPDYRQANAWARRPGLAHTAGPSTVAAADTPPRAAAFYIHPTTYSGGDRWNAGFDEPAVMPGVDAVVLAQASVLDSCCDVWAPRYRQASFGALGAGLQPYDFALLDVRRAFAQFLEEIGDLPFVILGHSQGALHSQRLLTGVIDPDPKLADRLVAAYIVGIPVPEAIYAGTLQRVVPCTVVTQTGCVASWATFSGRFTGLPQWRAAARSRYADMIKSAGTEAIQCTNPLRWDRGEAPARLNTGATMLSPATGAMTPPVPGLVGARCDDGALLVAPEPAPPFTALALAPGNYHLADIALFHDNVARNIANRVAAWWAPR